MSISQTKEKITSAIQNMRQSRKGIYALDLLVEGTIGLMVLALVVVVTIIIVGQMQTNTTLAPVNGTAYNALGQTNTAIATIPTWFTVFITVVVAVGLITLVLVLRQINRGKE
jgi:ABC-type uncharacterized transport system fused permease/ATPase subunit